MIHVADKQALLIEWARLARHGKPSEAEGIPPSDTKYAIACASPAQARACFVGAYWGLQARAKTKVELHLPDDYEVLPIAWRVWIEGGEYATADAFVAPHPRMALAMVCGRRWMELPASVHVCPDGFPLPVGRPDALHTLAVETNRVEVTEVLGGEDGACN